MADKNSESSTLLLITFKYPYGNGEPFLESELPYLRQRFDKILVQPIIGSRSRRQLPSGFTLCSPLYHDVEQRKFFLFSLLFPSVWNDAALEWLNLKRDKRPVEPKRLMAWAATKRKLERSEGVRRLLASEDKRVAYAYWGHTPALASNLFRKRHIPFAVRFHRVDLYDYGGHGYIYGKSKPQSFPWRSNILHAQRIFFISDHGKDYFEKEWPFDIENERIQVNRLGTFDYGTSSNVKESDAFTIVSCSRIAPVKQVELIAQFAEAMAKYSRKVVWHHFGSGNDAKALEAIKCAKKCHNLKVTLHGWVDNPEIMQFYQRNSVDLFVNLSRSEGIPVSIMEAISFGIPVLATAVDGTPEIVIEGESGFLCTLADARNSEDLANRVFNARIDGRWVNLNPREVWQKRFNADRNFAISANELSQIASG
ncbi:glycosyltransferase [Salipiger mucosus]|uniref:glycosyltransferase n=1 Tax=Salipiger mucosus TaxID=263378 RepID=UPI0018DB7DAF|nr:glycosyltransferase [Salipiger mucosus]